MKRLRAKRFRAPITPPVFTPAVNYAPVVLLITPLPGQSVNAGTLIDIAADVTDQNGNLDRVELYRNNVLVTTLSPLSAGSSRYVYSETRTAGDYTYKVKAFDLGSPVLTDEDSASITVVATPTDSVNVALRSRGATATASSYITSIPGEDYSPGNAINGNRTGAPLANGGRWNDADANQFPDWLEVALAGNFAQPINRAVVVTLQDNINSLVEPDTSLTTTLYGLIDFEVQYHDGTTWRPAVTVTANGKVMRDLSFTTISTAYRWRVYVTNARGSHSRIVEFELWTDGPALPVPASVTWTSPTAGQVLTSPANIPLAADIFGTGLSTVQLFRGTTLLHTFASSDTFSFTDSNVTTGDYTYEWVASVAGGGAPTRAQRSVSVRAESQPVVIGLGTSNIDLRRANARMYRPLSSAGANDANIAGRCNTLNGQTGTDPNGALVGCDIDSLTGTTASIVNGMLQFERPLNSYAAHNGDWFCNFIDDVTHAQFGYGPGESFYFAIDREINAAFADSRFSPGPGGGRIDPKMMHFNTMFNRAAGYRSLTSDFGKMVFVTFEDSGVPVGYNYGINPGAGSDPPWDQAVLGGAYHDVQPRIDDPTVDPGQYRDKCLRERDLNYFVNGVQNGIDPKSRPQRAIGCSRPERMTYKWKVEIAPTPIDLATMTAAGAASFYGTVFYVRVREWVQHFNEPSRLALDTVQAQYIDPKGGKIGCAFLDDYMTALLANAPAGRKDGAVVRYGDLIVSDVDIPDAIWTHANSYIINAPIGTWIDVPNSVPLTSQNITKIAPPWDPTGFRHWNQQKLVGSWCGFAGDKYDTKLIWVCVGGHSVGSETGAEWCDPVSSPPNYELLQQSSQLPFSDWPGPSSPIDDQLRTYFSDGRPLAGHDAAMKKVVYRRNGERIVLLPARDKVNFQAIGTSAGVPYGQQNYSTTAFHIDRSGEKYDLHQMLSNGQAVPGSAGWSWLTRGAGTNYPSAIMMDNWCYLGGIDGYIQRLDVDSDNPTWQPFFDFGTQMPWEGIATVADTKRRYWVSLSAGFTATTVGGMQPSFEYAFRWVDTRVPGRWGKVLLTLANRQFPGFDWDQYLIGYNANSHGIYDSWNDKYYVFWSGAESDFHRNDTTLWAVIDNLTSAYQTGHATMTVLGKLTTTAAMPSSMQGLVDYFPKARGMYRVQSGFENIKYCRLF